jgi:LPS-assembly lipoprotein
MKRRRFLALGFGTTALSGCGFHPIYMPTASGRPGVAARELAAVEVDRIPDRPGQLLRQALQERFASDAGPPHRYILSANFGVSGESIAIQTDNGITRVRLIGTVNWSLKNRDSIGAVLTSGSARNMDGVNAFDSQSLAFTLENEVVQKRMAENLADQITLQLATWFNRRAQQGAS